MNNMISSGLRYTEKEGGSPFGLSHMGACTMSCFLCGKHRNRPLLKGRSLCGSPQLVCKPNCKDLQAILDKGQYPASKAR